MHRDLRGTRYAGSPPDRADAGGGDAELDQRPPHHGVAPAGRRSRASLYVGFSTRTGCPLSGDTGVGYPVRQGVRPARAALRRKAGGST